jgi:hypothetical protein
MAVGLGSMDMPVPFVAEWEWLNWKFPRAVRAGETVYARWTLTQKRAPVGGSPTAIVVWRVDVLNAGGALCAEGEVGASVVRSAAAIRAPVEPPPARAQTEEPPPVAAAAPTPAPGTAPGTAPRRGRRRRRTPGTDGAKPAPDPKPAPVAEAPGPTPVALPTQERTASGTRRRRRRRSPSSTQPRNGDAPVAAAPPEAPRPPAAVPPANARAQPAANPLTRAIRRLRRP